MKDSQGFVPEQMPIRPISADKPRQSAPEDGIPHAGPLIRTQAAFKRELEEFLSSFFPLQIVEFGLGASKGRERKNVAAGHRPATLHLRNKCIYARF